MSGDEFRMIVQDEERARRRDQLAHGLAQLGDFVKRLLLRPKLDQVDAAKDQLFRDEWNAVQFAHSPYRRWRKGTRV